MFVKTAKQFTATVTVKNGDKETSYMSINSLGHLHIQFKDRIRISTEGADSQRAMTALSSLIRSSFGEPLNGSHESGGRLHRETNWLTVHNTMGMHARPSAMFVARTAFFDAAVSVEKDDEIVNGRDTGGLMMLAARRGERIKITTSGHDAVELMEALVDLIDSGFGEAW